VDLYLSPTDGGNFPEIVSGGSGLKMHYGQRFYLMRTQKQHSSPDRGDFHQLELLGKTINVTIDLNGASCGCNVAFYLVSMPNAGAPGSGNDWYCDANGVGGNWCPEVDLVEVNQNSWHATMHGCSKPYSSGSCDHGGYGVRFGQGHNDFGIGSDFAIDTTKPFVASLSFTDPGVAVSAHQGGRSTAQHIQDASNVRDALNEGMVLTMSYWGSSSMGWLDSPPCSSDPAQCPASVTLSDISVSSGSSPSPSPAPGPSPSGCPGSSSACDCAWTQSGAKCGLDDGSECFCRCCCPFKESGYLCKWRSEFFDIVV